MHLWRILTKTRKNLLAILLIVVCSGEVLQCVKSPPAFHHLNYLTSPRVSRGPHHSTYYQVNSNHHNNQNNNNNNNNNNHNHNNNNNNGDDSDDSSNINNNINSNDNQVDNHFASTSPLNFLRSPVYQMRFRQPNRFSQFVSSPPLHQHHDGVSITLGGVVDRPFFDSYRSEEGRQEKDKNKNQIAKEEDTSSPTSSSSIGWSHFNDQEEDEESSGSEIESPTFTPFISARALSNIGKFFEHLQENVLAIHQQQQHQKPEVGPLERRRMLTTAPYLDRTSELDSLSSLPSLLTSVGVGSGTGTADSSESDSSKSPSLTWPPPASRFFRNSSPGSSGSSGNILFQQANNEGGRTTRLSKMHTFIDSAADEESRLKFNSYNPMFLWLGLGRKK